MAETPRLHIPIPNEADQNDVPVDLEEAFGVVDSRAATWEQGPFSTRPAAGIPGRFFWASDYKLSYYDDGSQWHEVTRSSSWITWNPTFTAYNGDGEVIPSINITATEIDARYRLVANGSQCEIYFRALIKFTNGPGGTPFFGVGITLPVLPTKEWVFDADCNNGAPRAFVAFDSGVVDDPGRIVVYPALNSTAFLFPIDNVAKYWRINGVYEVAVAQGSASLPPAEETGGAPPTGAAGGALTDFYPNPGLNPTAVANRSVSVFQPPTANFPMNNKKSVGQAKGTNNTDGATMQNIGDHNADEDAHPTFAKYASGGRRIYTGATSVEVGVVDGEIQVLDDRIQKRKNGQWQTISVSSTPATGENTSPTTPGASTDVDRRANTMKAIDQWFAEFVNVDGYVIDKDLGGGNKVTSYSMAYGMMFAAERQNQAMFDLIRNKANAIMKRSVSAETFAPNLWSQSLTVGTGVTNVNASYGADYIRAEALQRACQLWNRQIDYDDLSLLAKELKACTLNTDEDRLYQVTDNLQKTVTNGHHTVGGAQVWEMSPGQLNMAAKRKLLSFTQDQTWTKGVAGDYDALTKVSNNSGGVPTSVGLFPDFAGYRTDTHDLSEILNASNGWTASKSRNYSLEALGAVMRLYADWKVYGDTRARDLLSGPLKAWAAARWATTNKFVTNHQQSDGSELSTTRKLHFAYAGYLILIANDPANATAANIKSTWLTGAMANNSSGDYFVADPPGVTATSTFAGNTWMILMESVDNGLYGELCEVPGIAGKYNATVTTGPAPGGGTATPTTPLPSGAVKLAIMRGNLAGVYANSLPNGTTAEQKKKARYMGLREKPQFVWTGPEWDGNGAVTEAYMTVADAQSAWFQLVMYGIPGRDLGGASAGGSSGAIEYRAWTDAVISKIGNRPGVVVIEPDSIALMRGAVLSGSKTQADFDARMALISELVTKLRNQAPNTRIYLDAAHAAWYPDPSGLVDGLLKAGVARCHGIVSNVSNFRTDAEVIPWSRNLLGKLNIPTLGYIWDCGRNGRNPAPNGSDWQNPLQVRFGRQAQYGGVIVQGDEYAHGALWVKNPGESDGNDNGQGEGAHGGPSAGQLYPEYLYNEVGGVAVADNANGSTSGTLIGSGNAGMLQRPPTEGVSGF